MHIMMRCRWLLVLTSFMVSEEFGENTPSVTNSSEHLVIFNSAAPSQVGDSNDSWGTSSEALEGK